MRIRPVHFTRPLTYDSNLPSRIVGLGLILVVVAVFGQLLSYDFITIDDNVYVTDNPYVRSGLTAESIRWAFTTLQAEF